MGRHFLLLFSAYGIPSALGLRTYSAYPIPIERALYRNFILGKCQWNLIAKMRMMSTVAAAESSHTS